MRLPSLAFGLLTLGAAAAPAPGVAAVDVTGAWNVCLECLTPCPIGGGTDTWTFTQSGTSFHVDIPGFQSLDGTIDVDTGVFTAPGQFPLEGVATGSTISATFYTLVTFGITGLRACDPLAPGACDDGDAGTVDTCCHTPLGVCDGPPNSCTHDDPPICVAGSSTTTVTTTSTTTSSSTSTTLIDRPVSAGKILLERSAQRERLVFTTRDAGVAFPPVGGVDDPATGMPGGATIEVFSRTEGQATFVVPPGVGRPGWAAFATPGRYRYADPKPDASSPVRKLVLREGKALTVVVFAAGLPLLQAQEAVAIRVTTGRWRTCALFDGATLVTDQAGKFLAKRASAASLPDCAAAATP